MSRYDPQRERATAPSEIGMADIEAAVDEIEHDSRTLPHFEALIPGVGLTAQWIVARRFRRCGATPP